METACKKNNDTRKTKTKSLFTSSLHILLLFKIIFISLFSVSHDILKTRDFRNNAIPFRIYLLQKIISHLRFENTTLTATSRD